MIKRLFLLLLLVVSITPAHAQLFAIITPDEGESQSGESPPAGWTAVEIEAAMPTHALNSTVLDYDTGTTTFTAGSNGGWIFGNDDAFGGWAFQVPVSGDFTLTARIVTASQEESTSKGGIMVRESLDPGSEHCMLAVFALDGTLVECRATTDGTTDNAYNDGVAVVLSECFRVSYDSDVPNFKLWTKTNATDCSTGTYTNIHTFAPGWTGYVLLATTPTDQFDLGQNATTTFDQVVTSVAAVDHTPGDVQFDPIAYPVNEDAGTVTLTVTRLGDGAGACSLDYVVNDGSGIAGTHYTDESGTVAWIDGNTDNKTIQIAVTDIPGTAQGDKQFTVVLTEAECPDTLNDATATVTIADQDADPSFFNAHTPTFTIQKDLAGYGTDWSAIITGSENYEYRFVTNLNTSGTGSLDAALGPECPSNTICVVLPVLSGKVPYSLDSTKFLNGRSRFVLAFHWAPSPGFHVERLSLSWADSEYVAVQNYSCFNDSTVSQVAGSCIRWQASSGNVNDHILLSNGGGLFAFDSAYVVGSRTQNLTMADMLVGYPLNSPSSAQGILLGTGASTNLAMIRGVWAHAQIRCPLFQSLPNALIAGPVCYNFAAAYFQTHSSWSDSVDGTMDLVDALYVRGPDSGNNHPIRYSTSTSAATLNLYVDGVRGFPDSGVYDDTPISNMITHQAGNIVAEQATSQATLPDGFVRTMIGSGDAGEQAYVQNACAIAGPRSGDRLPLYQQLCDELNARISGIGSQGGIIVDTSEVGGMPNVAVNGPCDPFVANDCNQGQPALSSEATANDPDTFLNKFWTANEAARCAVAAAGTPGCP